jgi:arylsulfatase B
MTHMATRPHLLYILADDFGWANADWHKDELSRKESATPFLSSLLQEGIELDRAYSYKFCSPSRSAIQSGRNPIHVNVQNLDPLYVNPADPDSGFAGIPRNMTGIAEVLKKAGYATYFFGKWDAGMATPSHTPMGRGYDTSLGYFHHLNDYWTAQFFKTATSTGPPGRAGDVCYNESGFAQWRPIDMWRSEGGIEGPARGLNNSLACGHVHTPEYCFAASRAEADASCPAFPETKGCVYEDGLFEAEVVRSIENHDGAKAPLFLFWSPHIVHAPLEVPERFLRRFDGIAADDWRRQRYLAMVSFMDSAVGNVTTALRNAGMYNHTLMVFTADNGGPIYRNGSVGANNWPLRGGKASNFEGGVRVNAFVSGGYVPVPRRGVKLRGLATLWDFYTTFAALASVSSTDARARAAGLPPVDGVNLWPWLAGESGNFGSGGKPTRAADAEAGDGALAISPRSAIALGSSSCVEPASRCLNEWGAAPSRTIINGLIIDERGRLATDPEMGLWKLLVGPIPMDGWQGPFFPNASTMQWAAESSIRECEPACLFELEEDPTEHHDLAAERPLRTQRMLRMVRSINESSSTFSPDRGTPDVEGACAAAMEQHGGFWGPWRR